MLRNWHHGHSLCTGLVGGLVLAGGHVLLLCGISFAGGILFMLAAINIRRILQLITRLDILSTGNGGSRKRSYITPTLKR